MFSSKKLYLRLKQERQEKEKKKRAAEEKKAEKEKARVEMLMTAAKRYQDIKKRRDGLSAELRALRKTMTPSARKEVRLLQAQASVLAIGDPDSSSSSTGASAKPSKLGKYPYHHRDGPSARDAKCPTQEKWGEIRDPVPRFSMNFGDRVPNSQSRNARSCVCYFPRLPSNHRTSSHVYPLPTSVIPESPHVYPLRTSSKSTPLRTRS